jgi:hypothetical protein
MKKIMYPEGQVVRLFYVMNIAFILFIYCNCRPHISYPKFYQNEKTIQFARGSIILSQSTVGFLDSKGTLAAWQLEQDSIKKMWSLNTPYYRELLTEDIDGDGKKEIIALGSSFLSEQNLGYGMYCKNKYFLDIYKESFQVRPSDQIAWLSTFQDSMKNNIVEEEDDPMTNGIFVTDLDGDGVREIVYATSHWIGVYKYIQETKKGGPNGHLDKILAFQPNLSHEKLHIKAISILEEQEDKIIVVSANVEIFIKGRKTMGPGYVLMYKYAKDKNKLILITNIRIDAILASFLKVANLDEEASLEIIAVGYKKEEDAYDNFLYILKNTKPNWTRYEYPIGHRSYIGPSIVIGVGKMNAKADKNEIVVLERGIMQIDIYEWENTLIGRLSKNLAEDSFYASASQIIIANIDNDEDNEIILAGKGTINPDNGDMFLGIYDQKLRNKWRVIGGGKEEMRVRALTIMD